MALRLRSERHKFDITQIFAHNLNMALAKKDLSQIKGVVHDEVENLARIVAKGFEQVDRRFEQVDKRFAQVDGRLQHIDARLNTIEHDITDIRKHFVYRDEF